MNDQIRRAEATNKTLDKYRRRAFDWHGASCIHLVRSHAINMGHRGLPMLPAFRSAKGALTALRSQGCLTLPELIDRHFARISPAQMMMGDVAALPCDDGPWPALVLFDGVGSLLGWHDGSPDAIRAIKDAMTAIDIAWRF